MIEQIRRLNYPELLTLETKYNTVVDTDFQSNVTLGSAWITRERFEAEANTPRTVGVYATNESGKILGYCIYRYKKEIISILKLEGDDASIYELLKHLQSRAIEQMRSRIEFIVDERRLQQQKTLSALGLKAKSVIRNHFDGNDGYLFIMEVEE